MPAQSSMTVREAAESRRDVRKYLQEEVPEEDLREVLRQTRLAPSPGNCQPWRFVVVRDPDLRARMLPATISQGLEGSARALIVLYADMEDVLATVDEIIHPGFDAEQRAAARAAVLNTFVAEAVDDPQQYAYGLAYIALGYLLLSAQAMGYNTLPVFEFHPEQMKDLLGLPRHVTIPALVAIGKGAEPGVPHHRHSVDRIARFL